MKKRSRSVIFSTVEVMRYHCHFRHVPVLDVLCMFSRFILPVPDKTRHKIARAFRPWWPTPVFLSDPERRCHHPSSRKRDLERWLLRELSVTPYSKLQRCRYTGTGIPRTGKTKAKCRTIASREKADAPSEMAAPLARKTRNSVPNCRDTQLHT